MCSPPTGVGGEDHSASFSAARAGLHPSLLDRVGGLQMAQSEFSHQPVLRDEVVALFASVPDGTVIDATLGGGGHSRALLETYPGLSVVGLDRDPVALAAAAAALDVFGERVRVEHAPFSSIGSVIASLGGDVSGVLFDVGVSSPQLDVAERGFSFRQDSVIDMRMDQSTGTPAAELVNTATEDELWAMFREAGETRFAGRIAKAVIKARPLTSTQQLADAVAAAVPAAARRKGHPARRVFMALRIAVNDELGELATALPEAVDGLAVGGVCVVISYHSGEDRLVKEVFASAAAGGCVCPPGLPCACGAVARHQLVFRGSRKPSATEVEANRRAESARMRAIVRTSERAA